MLGNIALSGKVDIMRNKEMNSKLNYYCSYCGKLFHLKWQLTAHIRMHENRTPHSCHICPASFVRNWDLKIHLKSHSDERPFQCKFCSKAFKTKFSKECHEDTHGANLYNCTMCQESFSTYMKLNRHKKRHTKSTVLKENGHVHYSCAFCNSFFLSLEFKKTHESSVHHRTEAEKDDVTIQVSKCPICLKKFPNGKAYRSHVYEVHPNEAESLFYNKCAICNKRVSSAFYSYHMMAHNGIKPHGCTVCDIKFTRKHDLLRHMDIHREETPFKCDECSKKFKCKKNLNMHLKSHFKKEQFCEMCGKAFATSDKLSNHKNRIHLRNQNLQKCDVCKKEVLNQYMSRHMKEFHCHEEKLCDHCGQTFQNSFKLRIHVSKFCKETDTYKSKSLFQQQIKSHNSVGAKFDDSLSSLYYSQSKECFLCGVTFTHMKDLKSHSLSHEYDLWKLSWNPSRRNVFRKKKQNGKKNGGASKKNRYEIYIVEDVKRPSSFGLSRDAFIRKYELVANVRKELSWIQIPNMEDKRKGYRSKRFSEKYSVKQTNPYLIRCKKCMKWNEVSETEPNELVNMFVCDYCSNVNKYENEATDPSLPLVGANLQLPNFFPIIIVAPSFSKSIENMLLKKRTSSPVRVEEPKVIIDETPFLHSDKDNAENYLELSNVPENETFSDAHSNSELPNSPASRNSDLSNDIVGNNDKLPMNSVANRNSYLQSSPPNSSTVSDSDLLNTVDDKNSELTISVPDSYNELPNSIADRNSELPSSIADSNSHLPNNIANSISELPNKIADSISELPNKIADNISEVPNKLADGISELASSIADSIDEFPGNVAYSISELPSNKVKILKTVKDKLAMLQGKPFISIDDLKLLGDLNIKTLLDYL